MSENVFSVRGMTSKLPLDLLQMDRAALEALDHAQLVELVCRLRTIAVEATERLALDSKQFPSSVLGPTVRPFWPWWDRGRRDSRWRPSRGIGACPESAVRPQAGQAAWSQGEVAR